MGALSPPDLSSSFGLAGYRRARRIRNPPQIENHCCPNWRGTNVIGQAKSLIPRVRLAELKSRSVRPIRCCPNCGPAGGALFLRQNGVERGSGGTFGARSLVAWLKRWRFAVQIGFGRNLIWTGLICNLRRISNPPGAPANNRSGTRTRVLAQTKRPSHL